MFYFYDYFVERLNGWRAWSMHLLAPKLIKICNVHCAGIMCNRWLYNIVIYLVVIIILLIEIKISRSQNNKTFWTKLRETVKCIPATEDIAEKLRFIAFESNGTSWKWHQKEWNYHIIILVSGPQSIRIILGDYEWSGLAQDNFRVN